MCCRWSVKVAPCLWHSLGAHLWHRISVPCDFWCVCLFNAVRGGGGQEQIKKEAHIGWQPCLDTKCSHRAGGEEVITLFARKCLYVLLGYKHTHTHPKKLHHLQFDSSKGEQRVLLIKRQWQVHDKNPPNVWKICIHAIAKCFCLRWKWVTVLMSRNACPSTLVSACTRHKA